MNALAGLAAQLLQGVLVLLAPPLLTGSMRWFEARMLGRSGAPPLREWRRMAALLRKQPVLADNASVVTSAAPYVAVAATLAAAMLVPTFARGMLLAPLSDIIVVAGLLALARSAAWLAALDAGTPLGGMGAARAMSATVIVGPVLLVATLVLAMLTGRTDLDALWSTPAAGPMPRAPLALCLVALTAAILIENDLLRGADRRGAEPGRAWDAMLAQASGRHLALWQIEASLRLFVWLALPVAMFLPVAAPAGAGPLAWMAGLLAWVGTIVAVCLLLALLRTTLPGLRPARARDLGWLAVLLALLGAVLAFVSSQAA